MHFEKKTAPCRSRQKDLPLHRGQSAHPEDLMGSGWTGVGFQEAAPVLLNWQRGHPTLPEAWRTRLQASPKGGMDMQKDKQFDTTDPQETGSSSHSTPVNLAEGRPWQQETPQSMLKETLAMMDEDSQDSVDMEQVTQLVENFLKQTHYHLISVKDNTIAFQSSNDEIYTLSIVQYNEILDIDSDSEEDVYFFFSFIWHSPVFKKKMRPRMLNIANKISANWHLAKAFVVDGEKGGDFYVTCTVETFISLETLDMCIMDYIELLDKAVFDFSSAVVRMAGD
ncbi:MAG: hypothetical protein K6E40_00450 [Desulfovibrio sp.]|nr:hypothetical protein [Desulfovibrio sp.]